MIKQEINCSLVLFEKILCYSNSVLGINTHTPCSYVEDSHGQLEIKLISLVDK